MPLAQRRAKLPGGKHLMTEIHPHAAHQDRVDATKHGLRAQFLALGLAKPLLLPQRYAPSTITSRVVGRAV